MNVSCMYTGRHAAGLRLVMKNEKTINSIVDDDAPSSLLDIASWTPLPARRTAFDIQSPPLRKYPLPRDVLVRAVWFASRVDVYLNKVTKKYNPLSWI